MKATTRILAPAALTLVALAVAGTAPGPLDRTQRQDEPTTRPVSASSPVGAMRFSYVDIYIDSHERPLAAFEVELRATSGDAKFVGVAGGDARGFQDPPYYDRRRMELQKPARIIIGAFSLSPDLPTGKTRVARVSVASEANENPSYAVRVIAAGTTDGSQIPADATFAEGAAQ